jgi:SMI1 / KNR4 family (SUKH-1)
MIPIANRELFARFAANPPASSALIAQCQANLRFQLPADYVEFLQQMNGGEGFMGDNEYLMLWRVEELAEMDAGYNVPEFTPELFLFGSNGGGEAFAFDTRSTPQPIVAVPFIAMELCDAIMIATNFRTFLEVLFTSGIPFSQGPSDEPK